MDRTRHILAALHDCPKEDVVRVGSHTACSVGNLFVIIHPLTGEQRSVCLPPHRINEFFRQPFTTLARREEYGHGVIHAVCRDFHLHTLRRLHTHLHRPVSSRRVRLLAKVRIFKIQPPSFSAMVTHDQPVNSVRPAAQTQSSAIVPRYCVAVVVA